MFSFDLFCYLSCIHESKTIWDVILIDSNIGVRFFKPVQIIGWWTDTYSFINGKICIMEIITYIKNTGSDYIYIRDRNVVSEVVSMCN